LGKHCPTSPSSIGNGRRRRTKERVFEVSGDKVLYFLCLNQEGYECGGSEPWLYMHGRRMREENIGWCLENLAMPFNRKESQLSVIANSKMVWFGIDPMELLG